MKRLDVLRLQLAKARTDLKELRRTADPLYPDIDEYPLEVRIYDLETMIEQEEAGACND